MLPFACLISSISLLTSISLVSSTNSWFLFMIVSGSPRDIFLSNLSQTRNGMSSPNSLRMSEHKSGTFIIPLCILLNPTFTKGNKISEKLWLSCTQIVYKTEVLMSASEFRIICILSFIIFPP